MIEQKPISFSVLGRIIGISGKKIYRWYKDVLSKFTDKKEQATLHKHDTVDPQLIDRRTGEVKTVAVPIFKPENFGRDMAIDDKNISGDGYTIISNKGSGKIALMAQSTKLKILTEIISKIPLKTRLLVKTISKDLAENYDWIARELFFKATRIADKFHVVQHAMEALQAIRIRYRQKILTEERIKREAAKARERERKEQCQRTGEVYQRQKIVVPKTKRYENGETKKELLAKSRYLLFSFEKDWSESQKERANIFFQEFPEVQKAYKIICAFRGWYKSKIGDVSKAREGLKKWYCQVGQVDIEELNNFTSLLERHEGEILNYFEEGHTNAYAESLNSQIQAFINANSGTRDRDFFHFRLKGYFS